MTFKNGAKMVQKLKTDHGSKGELYSYKVLKRNHKTMSSGSR